MKTYTYKLKYYIVEYMNKKLVYILDLLHIKMIFQLKDMK